MDPTARTFQSISVVFNPHSTGDAPEPAAGLRGALHEAATPEEGG